MVVVPWVEFPSWAVVVVAGTPAASAGLDRPVVAVDTREAVGRPVVVDTLEVVPDTVTSLAAVDKTEALPVDLTVASRVPVAAGTKAVNKMAWLPQVIEMERSGLAEYTAGD